MSHHYLIGDCIISSGCLLAKQAHVTPSFILLFSAALQLSEGLSCSITSHDILPPGKRGSYSGPLVLQEIRTAKAHQDLKHKSCPVVTWVQKRHLMPRVLLISRCWSAEGHPEHKGESLWAH